MNIIASRSKSYHAGFEGDLESEAIEGALPKGQNSPRQSPLGLISELISATGFAAPRSLNRRTYAFRIRPSTVHGRFIPVKFPTFQTPPLPVAPDPNQLRWSPFPLPKQHCDFLDGITTLCGNGAPALQAGMAIHVFVANSSMQRRYFANCDGDMLVVVDTGPMQVVTELGCLTVSAGEICVIPRGLKFRVDVPAGAGVKGTICESYGLPFRLPDLGLIGSFGLANPSDFQIPTASFETDEGPCQLIQKQCGNFWAAELGHNPIDVVAWRGNYYPCKYDMQRFIAIGTATVDHPDPSIYLALTSPGDPVLGGNVDFLILPPRWLVAEHTFRPPGFHRNNAAEFLGVIHGAHDSKADGYGPGSMSLHNSWSAHGPDVKTLEQGRQESDVPRKSEALVYMIETRMPMFLSEQALSTPQLQGDYADCWQSFKPYFSGS